MRVRTQSFIFSIRKKIMRLKGLIDDYLAENYLFITISIIRLCRKILPSYYTAMVRNTVVLE